MIPLLVVWANLHGSVILGAGLGSCSGRSSWSAAARCGSPRSRRVRSSLHSRLAVSDEAAGVLQADADRRAVFRDPARVALEQPELDDPVLYCLVALTALLVALPRSGGGSRSSSWSPLVVMLVGAVDAIRGVIWFALATMAILPVALDALIGRPDVVAPRVNRAITIAVRPLGTCRRVHRLSRPPHLVAPQWLARTRDHVP